MKAARAFHHEILFLNLFMAKRSWHWCVYVIITASSRINLYSGGGKFCLYVLSFLKIHHREVIVVTDGEDERLVYLIVLPPLP